MVSSLRLTPKNRKRTYILLPIVVILIIAFYYFGISKDTIAEPASIALLPLMNINIENEQEWFTEGMTDALITNLAKISGLRIISRSSVMRYKNSDKPTNEIAAELDVLYLIEGSVLRIMDKVRITTRLINAKLDKYIWVQEYERDFTDILTLQNDVAKEIAHQIKVKLSPQEQELFQGKRKINTAAYESYLKGNFNLWKLTKEGFENALKYFKKAVELDPEYAPAYAGIVLAWRTQAQMGFLPFDTVKKQSEDAEIRALELDSTLAEVHFMKAVNYTWGEWKWDLANAEFEKTLEQNPNMAEARAYYSQMLFIMNRPDEAMKQINLALKLDPFNNLFQIIYAMDLMYARKYDDLIKLLEDVLKTAPDEYIALSTLRSAYHQTKMYDKALEMWERSFEIRKDYEAIKILKQGKTEGGYTAALRGVAELMIKRNEEGSYVTPWQIATLFTRAGMKKEALDWFEKAFNANDPNMPYLKVDPIFDDLRNEQRFKSILSKMNLN